MIYLLDACALIAHLNQERGEGFEKVGALLDRAATGEVTLVMGIVNLVEVYYGYIRDHGVAIADAIMAPVADLPIQVISNITDGMYRETARFKGTYAMSLADAFLGGAATCLGATIVTKDGEFVPPEAEENLSILWLT
jgi:PIN domain nuclease of toxin-antitoxin system